MYVACHYSQEKTWIYGISALFQTTRAKRPTIPRTGLLVRTLKPDAVLPRWSMISICHFPRQSKLKYFPETARPSIASLRMSKVPPMPGLCCIIDPKKKLAPMNVGTPTSRNSKYCTCSGDQSISAIAGSSSHPCTRPSFAHAGLLLQCSNGT